MAGKSRRPARKIIIAGGNVFTPLGKLYQRVCIFTAAENALDDSIRKGLQLIYGSDPFAEASDEDSSASELPWWVLGTPLKSLDDSIALSCLERHLRKRRNLVPVTNTTTNEGSGSTQSMVLIYETNPAIKYETQDALSKESFQKYMESWSEIVYLGHGVDTESEDLTLSIKTKERTPLPPPPAAVLNEVPVAQPPPPPETVTAAGGPLHRYPTSTDPPAQRIKTEDPVQDDDQDNGAISLLTTEVIEINDDSEDDEEEIQGPANGGVFALDGQHLRRSNRVFLLDSMPKKKEIYVPPADFVLKRREPRPRPPATAPVGARNANEAGPSTKYANDEQQNRHFKTRPMPKNPVSVHCGDAKGLWNPHNPFVITVTQVGFGNGSPEAIAAAEELEKRQKKKKGSLVVACNQFEKIGGRGTHKNWKHSVRVALENEPQKLISISQFALEIGIPFEKKPRSGYKVLRPDGSYDDILRTPQQIEESKLLSIKEALIQAGYSARMAEKRLKSKRTFRGGHRPGHPGMYDYNLLLPGGIWVRSRDGIARNPKRPTMNENDVIFSDDDGEASGSIPRVLCRRTKHCICVQGHSGRCAIHPDFRRRRGKGAEKKPSTERKRKNEAAIGGDAPNDEDMYYSWEEIVDMQRGDRQERWLKRQGLWGDKNGGDVDYEEHSSEPSEDESGDYAGSLGFSSSREQGCSINEEEGIEGHHEDNTGTSKMLL